MTATGGGATEHFNLSGASGNPISERLQREGSLQLGSPMVIPAPGGQPGVGNWRDKDNKNPAAGGVTSTTSPTTPGGGVGVTPGGGSSSGAPIGGGGGFGGGGRPTK